MFKPKYSLTNKIINNVAQIERFYGQLESLQIPQQAELNLERDNLIKSSYFSNSIEGNPLSLAEVTNLLLDERIPTNRSEKEVCNYFSLLKNLSNFVDKPITIDAVLKIHRQLMNGVNDNIAGKIRNKKIIVGRYINGENGPKLKIKHEPPTHSQKEIEKMLNELFFWLGDKKNDLPVAVKAGIFHHQFVYIHPFADGNGRTCRLLAALIFLQNKYFINKYFVLDDYYDIDKHLYSDSLHSADNGDCRKWLEYFSDGVKYSLQGAIAKVKNILSTFAVAKRPSNKEKFVLNMARELREITSNDAVENLNISRQQAHNLLSSLVKKGFLNKRGGTKGSYYVLK